MCQVGRHPCQDASLHPAIKVDLFHPGYAIIPLRFPESFTRAASIKTPFLIPLGHCIMGGTLPAGPWTVRYEMILGARHSPTPITALIKRKAFTRHVLRPQTATAPVLEITKLLRRSATSTSWSIRLRPFTVGLPQTPRLPIARLPRSPTLQGSLGRRALPRQVGGA